MPPSPSYRPARRHAELGAEFYDEVEAAAFPKAVLRYRNRRAAREVGLDTLDDGEWIDHFGRFTPLPGSFPQPLALRYHGHQFRAYNPDLGDGRGFLFAQLYSGDGRLLDLGTKGSGRTPWSRGGDGRLTLKGGVRELLATGMLEALGVDTSRTFSLIETGEALVRGDESSPTRSAVLVRLSHSHVRIGSFQRLAYLGETDGVARLLDYVIRTYMPEAWRETVEERAVAFLEGVGRRVAATGAAWMLAGFVHGVLNTDNINVTGESFDYGPWRFLPRFDPGFTAAYFDESGLYAYGRQPATLSWNLTRLAECLLPLAPQARLEAALGGFVPAYRDAVEAAMLRRLGLGSGPAGPRGGLADQVWAFLQRSQMPFEGFFFDWHGGAASEARAMAGPRAGFYGEDFAPLRAALGAHEALVTGPLHSYFMQPEPCTMLIEEVEALWAPIAEQDDWSALDAKLAAIAALRAANGRGANDDAVSVKSP